MNYFSKNLKYLREKNNLSKSELAEKIGVNQSTLSRWENEDNGATVDNALDLATFFNVTLADLVDKDLHFDNAEFHKIEETIAIPVLGVIKAGIPIEAQQDIIDTVNIPKNWQKGGKKFYALKIKGDSMSPKYNENDIVIFELNDDVWQANRKDCAVMVNGYDATFKNVIISENGITLIPLNPNNHDGYQPTFYDPDQISSLPVRIIGIAKRRISDM